MPTSYAKVPTRADARMQEELVINILAAWHNATPLQVLEGRAWYANAHALALQLGDGNVRKGAGVLAALSANCQWARNVRLAREAFATGQARGHFGDALHKAQTILDGTDPADVLPMSAKTGQFFLCISEPHNATAVCIDRHAHDIAIGRVFGAQDRGLSTSSRYDILAAAYREAARRLGELPSVVQAITWVAHTASQAAPVSVTFAEAQS